MPIPPRQRYSPNQLYKADILSGSLNDGSFDNPKMCGRSRPATAIPIDTAIEQCLTNTIFAQQGPPPGMNDFNSLFQNFPHDALDSFMPQGSMLDGRTTTGDDLHTPKTVLEAKTPGSGELWPCTVTSYDPPALGGITSPQPSAAQLHLNPGLNCCEIDPTFVPTQQVGFDSSSLNYPPLPELPSSGDDHFDFQSGPSVPTIDQYLPAMHYQELEPSSVLDQDAQYPDLWACDATIQSPSSLTSSSVPPGRHLGVKNGQRDTSKDTLLVQLKDQGMSYKVIKERLQFEEAESTLRGRYRALTKPREARLRKPEWGDRDIQLLFEAVSHCSKSNPINLQVATDLDAISIGQFVNKVPWKQVAEYMESSGAYRYGNATVKKKYLEVLRNRGTPV
ncbi:uncharacterized protein Z519_06934 [Cladophialophora bantiana CBS 173.52]|uniref:Myb-like domain-containing protein n=1 Tax=Cladophialophora bantiana (strain ATCC 10958 / CBS 173.52 / CDC B-1940 / NIH 8579) TaxID=1442370 RepID=A0A0D2FZQ5_CLAB1|nr:uncharacterized protein Z519_06934 [Cladophialophora bantiana CBS 173.52]KIW91952.1 hypothetical protein Z519_06934 [Cladophialophora bantiana CBS 173.52]